MYSCSAYSYLLRWSHRSFYRCAGSDSETFNLCLVESLPALLAPISWPFLMLQQGRFRKRSRGMWLCSCMYFSPFCVVILNFLSNLLQVCVEGDAWLWNTRLVTEVGRIPLETCCGYAEVLSSWFWLLVQVSQNVHTASCSCLHFGMRTRIFRTEIEIPFKIH